MGRSLTETLGNLGHEAILAKPDDSLDGYDQVWLVCAEGPTPKTTAPLIGFGWSDPNWFSEERFRVCHVWFTQSLEVAAKYPEKAVYLPIFADPRYFKPQPALREPSCVFVGFCPHQFVQDRAGQVAAVRAAGLPLHVYGQFWPEHPDTHAYVQGEALLTAINKGTLCLDLTNATTSLSSRIFQSSLCEVPVLTCDRPDLRKMLEPEREVLLYQTEEEMIARAQEFMAKPDMEIGKRARLRCLQEHLPLQRVAKILACVKERLG